MQIFVKVFSGPGVDGRGVRKLTIDVEGTDTVRQLMKKIDIAQVEVAAESADMEMPQTEMEAANDASKDEDDEEEEIDEAAVAADAHARRAVPPRWW